ncbi:hypothetical protein K0504_16780 [Neiella marina]|uniref:Uncharacterized protein n=1 Tax=Neiella holothuriorum TaxID=2870530 RepID=A0ABS7EK27_9GAMM|nr:AhpA/YtjB family protein [Neiella holothuriorum]MBW8192694.1 hypothetical protein [Neiella holothuriorum]
MSHSTIRLTARRKSRLWQLLLAIVLIMVIFQILRFYQLGRNDMLQSQSFSLTRAIVEQSATAALPALRNEDDDALHEMANTLIQNPAIFDVAIYDHQGILLATNTDYTSLRERLPELTTTDKETQLSSRVAPIYDQQEVVGFIQLTLSYASLQRDTHNQSRQLDDQIRLALLFSVIAGFLLSSSIRRGIRDAGRWRPKSPNKQAEKSPSENPD